MTSPYATPAMPPPRGQESNFADPISLLKWEIVCITVCLSVTTTVFLLRMWVRLIVMKQWILEDYVCCISYIGLVIYCTLMTVTFKRHGGVHEWDLTLSESYNAIYWFNAASIVYAPVILCTKLTVLLLYRRVFLPLRGSLFDVILRVFMVICCVYYITTIPVKIWGCTPRARIWNKSIEGSCINVAKVLNADGVFNTLSDIVILLVPIKALWKLQMKTKKKIGIGLLFTVGLIAPVFSIIGWVVRRRNSRSQDIAYHDPKILLWGTAELSAGLTCTCLPTIPALFSRRRTSRSDRILEINSRSRHLRILKRKQLTDLGDKDPFNRDYVERSEGYLQNPGVVAFPAAVATDIEGGKPDGIQTSGPEDLEAEEEASTERPAIIKTVVIKQSHNVRT